MLIRVRILWPTKKDVGPETTFENHAKNVSLQMEAFGATLNSPRSVVRSVVDLPELV